MVTAIVSVFNAARFLAGCLEDLAGQTLGDALEIVVIDACSPQNERDIVAAYRSRLPNLVYVRLDAREGVYASWNRGVRLAQGRYLTNANADDRHRSDALEVMARALDAHPEVDFVYGDSLVGVRENETYEANRGEQILRFPTFFAPATLLYSQLGPQPLWRKTAHEKTGFFDEEYRACADWDFNIRLAGNARGLHLPQALGLYLEHAAAITFRDDAMPRENDLLRRRWQHPAAVEDRYRIMGVPGDTPKQRALLHLDMGIRSLRFYPPWRYGAAESNLPFARRLFRHALRLDADLSAARELLALPDAVVLALPDISSPLGLPSQRQLAGFS